MMNRRGFFAALPALAATATAFAVPDPKTTMGSEVFDWNSIPEKTTSYGKVRSFFNSPTATLENLELHVTTLNPGKAPHPPHRHPNEEMLIIQQGMVEALQNGDWKSVGPGSVIFNASNQLHGVRNNSAAPAVYHVINWKTAATPAR
ncbi:MAG: cupin domain-containing protein [Acidobacteriota bacterium]|nr:cupin domain-containing protein [Acidobacteriota bacterium]